MLGGGGDYWLGQSDFHWLFCRLRGPCSDLVPHIIHGSMSSNKASILVYMSKKFNFRHINNISKLTYHLDPYQMLSVILQLWWFFVENEMIHTNSYTGTFYPWVIIQFSVNIKFITFTFNSDYSTARLLAHI